jgi:Fanconi anemia group M protein
MPVDERWLKLGNASQFLNLGSVEYREYQINIIDSIRRNGNTLVVLPTGLGKTFIGASVMAEALASGRKAMLLAPTKPLAEQHYSVLSGMMNVQEGGILLLTGSMNRKSRSELENSARLIIATPQTVANDLKAGNFSLDGFGTVVFDECHRAVGKYAYTYIANECTVRDILVVGLTASPGSKKERINALVSALGIRHIEARSSSDNDVSMYVMQKSVHVVYVDPGSRIREIADYIKPEMDSSISTLKSMGLLRFNTDFMPKGRLIDLGNQISKIQATNYRMGAMAAYSKLINLSHAHDLILTEGIAPFSNYIEGLYVRENRGRSLEALLRSRGMIAARERSLAALKKGEEHPKVAAVLNVLRNCRGKKSIVFAQYRSTVKMLSEWINSNGIRAMSFVGKKEGVTQEAQKKVVQDFRNGAFEVLVASSIGEEGMDIPGVDTVIFYEPIPNEIRNIQRRGRTARFSSGNIYIIVARGTKDQIYLRVSEQREMKMMNLIHMVNARLAANPSSEMQSRL